MGRPPGGIHKRDELIAAALHLFREKGYAETSIRDLAAAAGVTSGALYRHFASKQALAAELFESCARRLTGALSEARETVAEPGRELESVTRALLEFSRREPDCWGFLLERHVEQVTPDHVPARLPKDVVVEAIAAGCAAGAFPGQDAELTAAMIIGMCQRAVFFYDRGLTQRPWPQVVDRVVQAARLVAQAGEPAGPLSREREEER